MQTTGEFKKITNEQLRKKMKGNKKNQLIERFRRSMEFYKDICK